MINFDYATDPIWNTVNTIKWEATCTDGRFPTNLGADSFEGETDTIDPDKKTSTMGVFIGVNDPRPNIVCVTAATKPGTSDEGRKSVGAAGDGDSNYAYTYGDHAVPTGSEF